MKKILFFLFILLSCSLFAQNPIPFGSPIQVKLKSPNNYLIGIQTAATVDTFTHGVGITGIYTIKNTANDICFNYNGGLSKCVSTLGTSSYVAGTGISISGTTLNASTTSALWNANQLQGRSIATTIPTSGNVLGWNGSVWLPTIATSGSNYAAGTGLTLTTNTFSHTAHTGDATGTTSLTVVALRGYSISTTAPTVDHELIWDGTQYLPSIYSGRMWSDTMTVSRTNDSVIVMTFSTALRASQFAANKIDHILRWKRSNAGAATDSVKCAVITICVPSGTNVTVTIRGDYFRTNATPAYADRLTSVSYSLYEEAKYFEWFIPGMQIQDTSAAVGKRFALDSGKVYRFIYSAGYLGATGTGTRNFAYNIEFSRGTNVNGTIIQEVHNGYYFGGYTRRVMHIAPPYRVITGGIYWLSLRTPIVTGTTVASDLNVRLYYINNSLLNGY